MNVLCPSCKTMVNFEDDGVWTASGVDIWRALLWPLRLLGRSKDAILNNREGDDRWTCPRCGESLLEAG